MYMNVNINVKKLFAVLVLLLCSSAIAEVVSLDISDGFNYDGFISQAECDHAYLYDPPASWSISTRMVHSVFGEHSISALPSPGRGYAWQSQVPAGGTGLPDSGQITTNYGTFELCTDIDAEPVGGYTQISAPTTPTGLLPINSNIVRVYRPHTGSTGNPLASATVTLPTAQQDYYDSINFLVSGSNGKVMIYAEYDDGQGGTDSELIYTSPGTPKTASETGFPDVFNTSSTNTDIAEVSSYQMDYAWTQRSNYSEVRGPVTTCVWTFDDALELDSSEILVGFTLEIYDEDSWKTRTAIIYAASANKVDPTYYVDGTNGDDTTGTGSQLNPWATIDKALDECDERDTIIVKAGSYDAIELYSSGGTTDLFSDWVTIKAADGETVEVDSIYIAASGSAPSDPYQYGTFNAYLRFEDLEIPDGVSINGAKHWALIGCLIEREGPWTGSVENIEKTALNFRNGTDILIQDCEITNTGTAIAGRGHEITLKDSYLHDCTHDGIRVIGWWDSLIEGTTVCRFDDTVTDAEATWSRHCDLIHFFIPGPGPDGWQNHNVVVRDCRFFDTESQGFQFNNYYATADTVHNEQILIENCVFGPTHANQINNADPTDGLIIRSCTSVVLDSPRTFGRWTLNNNTWRIGSTSTGVEIYNNLIGSCSPPSTTDIDIFDWNALQIIPSTSPSSDETGRALGRFTYLGLDPDYVNPTDFTGEIGSNTEVDDLGTVLNAPDDIYAYGINGVARDNRPDLGAWELAGHSPAVEDMPTVYNDAKSIFVDDFEDGSYTDVDPWLEAQYTQGMSWGNPASATMPYKLISNTTTDNNLIQGPVDANKMAWLICDQGSDWADYDFAFSASNAYVSGDSGVMLLVQDEDNYYWLDIGRDTGDLYRIIGGTATLLSSDNDIKLPHSGWRDYAISVSHDTNGEIIIDVNADDDGDIELSYTDSNATAISTFPAGTVGFHTEFANQYLRVSYDDITVVVTEFDN